MSVSIPSRNWDRNLSSTTGSSLLAAAVEGLGIELVTVGVLLGWAYGTGRGVVTTVAEDLNWNWLELLGGLVGPGGGRLGPAVDDGLLVDGVAVFVGGLGRL